MKEVVPEIIQIWNEVGISEETSESLKTLLSKHKVLELISCSKMEIIFFVSIQELWGGTLIKEKERKERLLSRINTLEKKHKSLCEELGIVYIEVESDATLQKRENLINEEVIKLEKEKDVRMEPIRALFHGRDQLCEELKVPCSSLNQDHILTSVHPASKHIGLLLGK